MIEHKKGDPTPEEIAEILAVREERRRFLYGAPATPEQIAEKYNTWPARCRRRARGIK